MSSVNTTCFNNKLSDFVNYFNMQQTQVNSNFSGASINNEFKYKQNEQDDQWNIKTIHPSDGPFFNISPSLFAEYLMEKVFKITTKYNNGNVYTNFDESYINIIGGSNNHYELPSINNIKTLLAGTLFSYQIERYSSTNPTNNFYLNAALLLEEVYDNSGEIINSINLELRQKEPLMSNITSCNGTVYNFKEGVKLSDFANYIEQGKNSNAAPYGYVNYHSLLPTNLSINNANLNTYVENTNFIKNAGNIYKNESVSFPSGENDKYTTNFTGYLVIGGFYNNTVLFNKVDEIEKCKPYFTIIRIVRSSPFQIKYDSQNGIFEITSDGLLFRKITSDYFNTITNQGDNKWNIPYQSVLDILLPGINSNLSNSGECYILKKLTDDNNN